jgi:hypothetical protein
MTVWPGLFKVGGKNGQKPVFCVVRNSGFPVIWLFCPLLLARRKIAEIKR